MGYAVEEYACPAPVIKRLLLIDESREAALLLDISKPAMSGFEVHDALIQKGVATPVIYITAHGTVPDVVEAMSKGAITLLEKPLDKNALQQALDTAFSRSIQLRRRVRANHHEHVKVRESLSSLSKREGQIVQGILADMSNQSLAEEFNISIKTVELHRSNVMAKLEARNAAHLVRMVMACERV